MDIEVHHVSSQQPSHSLSLSLTSQGSNATGDCCSKCFNALQKSSVPSPAPPSPQPVASPEPTVDEVPAPVAAPEPTAAPTISEPIKKKKKKKTSYKNMLAGMMEGSGARDVEKEKETIKRVTGGGQFSKIDKI